MLQANSALSFFVQAADGLSFVTVLDGVEDGSSGNARMTFNLTGDTADVLVRDDPREVITEDRTNFTTSHGWISCCTDGFALGSLDGDDWLLSGSFLQPPTGISNWSALGADGSSLALALNGTTQFSVPAPATMLFFGLSLVGMAFTRRRTL